MPAIAGRGAFTRDPFAPRDHCLSARRFRGRGAGGRGCSHPWPAPHLFQIAACQRQAAAKKPALHRHVRIGSQKPFGSSVRGAGLASIRFHSADVAETAKISTASLGRVLNWDRATGKGKRRIGPEKDHPHD